MFDYIYLHIHITIRNKSKSLLNRNRTEACLQNGRQQLHSKCIHIANVLLYNATYTNINGIRHTNSVFLVPSTYKILSGHPHFSISPEFDSNKLLWVSNLHLWVANFIFAYKRFKHLLNQAHMVIYVKKFVVLYVQVKHNP